MISALGKLLDNLPVASSGARLHPGIRAQLSGAGQEGRISSCHLEMPTLHPCPQHELRARPAVPVLAAREDKLGIGLVGC